MHFSGFEFEFLKMREGVPREILKTMILPNRLPTCRVEPRTAIRGEGGKAPPPEGITGESEKRLSSYSVFRVSPAERWRGHPR